MKRHSSIVFILCIKLLVALDIQSANATNQITKLKIGKFFLECEGECTELYKFRDQGFLKIYGRSASQYQPALADRP